MNNLSWSGEKESPKKDSTKKEDLKKKKISYTKEIEDLQKIHNKIEEKYSLMPHNKISGALVDIRCALENLKKFEY